ncbi:hypothetical protein ACFVYP_14750 [Kitasatospora sp. NPDC058201]|uniref:hypothetical protein n=1 Tax=unclassified Kitasatospora TaxID=2633591 RepID=UPI003659BE39
MTALDQQQPADEVPDAEPKNAGRLRRDGVRQLLAVWRAVKTAYDIWQLLQDLLS